MKGKSQGSNAILINAPQQQVWDTIIDSGSLHEWVDMIKEVDNPTSSLNAERSCQLEFNGKKGSTNETCVVFDAPNKLGWVVYADTFGFTKMLDNYGLQYSLSTRGDTTEVTLASHYDPKNLMAKLMNTFMMKRMNNKMRGEMLESLKKYVEAKN
jgi:uncharacterized membrane protein